MSLPHRALSGAAAVAALAACAHAQLADSASDIYALTNDSRLGSVDLDAPSPLLGPPTVTLPGSYAGIEYVDGRLFALSTLLQPIPNSIIELDPQTGALVRVRSTARTIREGDLAYDPTTGRFLGSASDSKIFEVDPLTGATTTLPLSLGEWNGLAFDDQGNLFGLRAGGFQTGSLFVRLDPVTGEGIENLTHIIAGDMVSDVVTGLDFDPTTGTFIAAGFRDTNFGTQELIRIDVANETTTSLGTLPESGISGVAVIPAPGTLAPLALLGLAARRRRP